MLHDKKPFFIISLFPEDNAEQLKKTVSGYAEFFTGEFYKVGNILKLLQEKSTKQVLFVGKVDKRNLLKKIKFDWLSIKLLASLACKSDKSIMERLLDELKKYKIEVLRQDEVLKSLLIKPGILAGKITPKVDADIKFGLQAADNISFCDIGQTIVVKDKMVIAVEAIEGTDECINRGIQLGKKEIVICKTAHKNQNKKYDLPTLGPNSLKNLKAGQVKAIAWKSDQTFIADKEEFIKKAKELGIALVSV